MAGGINPIHGRLNIGNPFKFPVGRSYWCFGTIFFTAGDTYVAGGFDPRAAMRKQFNVADVISMLFMGTSSDATTKTLTSSRVQARYAFTAGVNGATESGLVKLYSIGRDTAGNAAASEVELTTGDTLAGLSLSYMAICQGETTTRDSTMGPG